MLAFCLYCVKTKKNSKIQLQNVTSRGNRTPASHSLWFQVQHSPFYTNLTFACKTENLVSIYSHALLIPLNPAKSQYQVVYEQGFSGSHNENGNIGMRKYIW